MKVKRKKLDPNKLRTRYEPPTVEEAIFAAQGLTAEIDSQTEIAAMLMGLPEEEVRPLVIKASQSRRPAMFIPSLPRQPAGRTVVVERRFARPSR